MLSVNYNNLEKISDYQHLLHILNNQQEMIFCLQLDSVVTFANDAYCKFMNQDLSDLIGAPLTKFLSNSQGKKLLENISYVERTKKPISYEHKLIRLDDKVLWHRWIYSPILDRRGQLLQIQAVGRDITYAKLELERLRTSEKTLRYLFNSQNHAMFLLGKDQEILNFNQATQQLVQKIWHRKVGINQNIREYIYPEDLSAFVSDIDRVLQGEHISREKQLNGQDGTMYWFEFNFSPVYDEHSNLFAIALNLLDITKRKTIEEQIKKAVFNRATFWKICLIPPGLKIKTVSFSL
ncbi:MAG: PAS domain S-box protein [Bacteroidia bacterium]|nr:PAS domain S-box protein [Bacteroidia bacterium]